MKRLFLLFSFLLAVFSAKAQLDFNSNLYFQNNYLTNPAAIGVLNLQAISIKSIGNFIEPNDLFYANISGAFEKYIDRWNSGIGMRYDFVKSGPFFANFNYGLLYNYRLKVSDSAFFSIGTEVAFFQERIDFSSVLPGNQRSTASNVDINLGLLFKTKNLLIGLSTRHVNQPKFKHNIIPGPPNQFSRVHFATIQYDIHLHKKFTITPSTLFSTTERLSIFGIAGATFSYDKKIFAGAQYRLTPNFYSWSFNAGGTIAKRATLLVSYQYSRLFSPSIETLLRFTF